MKKMIAVLLIALSCFSTISCTNRTQKIDKRNEVSASEVPTAVKNTFAEKYPAATNVVWEKAHEDSDDTYKAKFKTEGDFWKAEFKGDGTLIKVKKDLD